MLARITLGLLALGAGALPLSAVADADTKPLAHSPANNIVVTRDAETGQLRAATAAESAALLDRQARLNSLRAAVLQTPLPKVNASGARGVRLTDEMASYSVVVRNADGSLSTQCFQSKEAADAAMKANEAAGKPARAEE